MHSTTLQTPVDILLVEDDPDDVFLLRQVMEQGRLPKSIYAVESGEDALRFLHKEPPYEHFPRPKLILLDLFLPGLSGVDVLIQVQQDPSLRSIPVVMLTDSAEQQDIVSAYDEGVRAYVTKPCDRASFKNVVQVIEQFWIETAKLPVEQ